MIDIGSNVDHSHFFYIADCVPAYKNWDFVLHRWSLNDFYISNQLSYTGYPVILPRENESVLLGAAILGSVAAKKYPSLHKAMKALNAAGQVRYLDHWKFGKIWRWNCSSLLHLVVFYNMVF